MAEPSLESFHLKYAPDFPLFIPYTGYWHSSLAIVNVVHTWLVSDPTTYHSSSPIYAFCTIARIPLNPAALAVVSFGIVLVRVRVRGFLRSQMPRSRCTQKAPTLESLERDGFVQVYRLVYFFELLEVFASIISGTLKTISQTLGRIRGREIFQREAHNFHLGREVVGVGD